MTSPAIPDTELARTALDHVRSIEHPAIFNHSMRVFHIAAHLATPETEVEPLFYACLFHDSGTADVYNGEQRFEVEGADAAARFLERAGWAPAEIQPVWSAIALHTSPGIAERFGPVVRLTRLGVLADFGRRDELGEGSAELRDLLKGYPRLDIETVLSEAVVAQALATDTDTKAPSSSWPGRLVAEHLANPGHEGVNPGF